MANLEHLNTGGYRPLTSQLRLRDGVKASTLTGNVSLTDKTAQFLYLDPGGSSRDVTLPPEPSSAGLFFVIKNTADAAENLVVKDDSPATVVTLNRGEWAIVGCDGTTWRAALDSSTLGISISADVIAEFTSAAGVTIDGLLLKDKGIDASGLATGEGYLGLKDNVAAAWTVKEGATAYLTFVTTDSSESITFGKPLKSTAGMSSIFDVSAAATGESDIVVADNLASALEIREAANIYLKIVTTDNSEAVAAEKRITTTDGVASGTARVVGGRAACITAAGTAHTGSTDEAVLASYTIPANTIKAGTVVKCKFLARVTADNGATTLTGRLRLGATTLTGTELIVTGAVDTSSGHVFCGEFTLVGRAAPGAAAAVVGYGTHQEPGAIGGALKTDKLDSTNFATNGALLLEVTADWSAADANSVQAEIFIVEVIG